MSVRVRFAPSPTGFLHVGGARTALYNWLFARAHGGTFVLRIEDTDAQRSTDDSMRAILDGMRWLGLSWAEGPGVGGKYGPYFQTERRERYDARAKELLASGHAYECWCTADELAARRAEAAERGEEPRYDGKCRRLTAAEREAKRASGAPAVLRFATPAEGEVAWDDVVRGRITFRNDVLDDFVLVRTDGLPTYNFACVVDDLDMEISHVIRGDDHISNTPRQLLLYAAFGAPVPVFAHASMILGPDGKRLSKRHGATSVEAFGDLGIVPEGMVNFLALLGWAYDGKQELFTLDELAKVFTLEKVGANPAVFDTQKLEWVNGQHLKRLDEGERVRRVRDFLAKRGDALAGRSDEWVTVFVRALGERLRTLCDAETVGAFALSPTVAFDEPAFAAAVARPGAREALAALADTVAADSGFSLASLEAATRALAAARGMKAGELIGLARLALTGQKTSPGIFEVLWLVGRDGAVARLRAAAVRPPREEPT
ncbi:MAG: glutamate--tRNA ligase [Candidatus Eisenbacteria bacterium]